MKRLFFFYDKASFGTIKYSALFLGEDENLNWILWGGEGGGCAYPRASHPHCMSTFALGYLKLHALKDGRCEHCLS